jgi:hypothetical protein
LAQEITGKYKPVAIYILYHQMFSPPNIIRDRKNIFKVPIEGSGEIIQKMLEIMLEQVKLWESGEEEAFIEFLSKEVGLESKEMLEKYHERLEYLTEEQKKDKPAKLMLVYCDVLTTIMTKIKDDVLEQFYELMKANLTEEQFEEIINNLPEKEDATLNLVLNLAILMDFAKITEKSQPKEEYNEFFSNLLEFIKQKAPAN